MKNKKGFTLVELLAVIVVIAIIMLIAVPSTLQYIKKAKKGAFQDEVRVIYKAALDKFVEDENDTLFETGSLDLKSDKELTYSILFNDDGDLICYEINNDDYIYRYETDGSSIISNANQVAENIDDIIDWDHNIISDCTLADQIDTVTKSTIIGKGTWWKFTSSEINKNDITTIIIANRYTNPITDNTIKYNIDDKVAGGITVYAEKGSNIAYIINNSNRSYRNAFTVTDATNMFSDFPNLKQIQGLKLLDMSNVTSIDNMFSNCPNLTQVKGIEYWDVSKVTSAKNAFAGTKISNLNLSTWDTSSLTDVTGMFQNTKSKQINLGGWDVSNVTKYTNMFNSSTAESLILSGWNTRTTADYSNMFSNCTYLTTILTSKNFKVSSNSINMFTGDTKIKGENGTTYKDGTSKYAKVDTASQVGYFTGNSEDGLVNAKLYNSGSVSNEYTSLTETGTIPADWNYYDGVRLLEIDISYMNTSQDNTLEITVPTGMYIKENSWTTNDSKIKSVEFIKNTSQGTGTYSNNFTGTLKYVIKSGTSSIKLQCLVMFDEAIWDKNKYKDSDIATGKYMTTDAPVTVDYNSGTSIKKIANIKSAIGVGRSTEGFSLYTYPTSSNVYIDEEKQLLNSDLLLSTDQSYVASFYKHIKYTTYATSTDSSGKTIYADVIETTMPGHLGTPDTKQNSNGIYIAEWSNKYKSVHFGFPILKYKLDKNKGFVAGKQLKLTTIVELTSYSGQVTTKTSTQTYTIKNTTLDISDLIVGGGSHESPYDTYYGSSGLIDVLGYTAITNKGYKDFNNVTINYKFDVDRDSTGKITQRTYAINLPAENGQEVTIKATMINDAGKTETVTKTKKSLSNNSNGLFINAEDFKSGYYFKEITYTLPKISGTKGNSNNYLYCNQCAQSQTGGGVFMGTVANTGIKGRTTITVTAQGYETSPRTATVYSSGTDTPMFSGTINQIKTSDGKTEYSAGDDIELDIQIMAVDYPYTTTQAFSKPEIYIALPEGMSIDRVSINNSLSATTSEVGYTATKIKTADIKGQVHNIYKIAFKGTVWFGYVYINPTSTSTSSLNPTKWIKVNLSTDTGMDYTSMNLRDTIYFKDANGHINISGSWGKSITTDKYDVDNDGSTSDTFGVIQATNNELIIREVTEE